MCLFLRKAFISESRAYFVLFDINVQVTIVKLLLFIFVHYVCLKTCMHTNIQTDIAATIYPTPAILSPNLRFLSQSQRWQCFRVSMCYGSNVVCLRLDTSVLELFSSVFWGVTNLTCLHSHQALPRQSWRAGHILDIRSIPGVT